MRPEGLILAGGSGRRMGGPKALLPFRGVPLLVRTAEVLRPLCAVVRVATRREFRPLLERFGLPILLDEDEPFPLPGPLAGLHAGCRASDGVACLIAVATDHPFLSAALLSEEIRLALEGPFDAVLPGPAPRLEPLHAVYRPRAIAAAAREAAAAGRASLHEMLLSPSLAVRYVGRDERRRFDPEDRSLVNVNSREDLERAESLFP